MKTPTTVLLVVIAVLLAANLFVNLPPQEATAQPHRPVANLFNPPPEPTVVSVSLEQLWTASGPTRDFRIVRAGGDGEVDVSQGRFASATSCVIDLICPPEAVTE